MKDRKVFRAMPFLFDDVEPGATAAVEKTEMSAFRLSRVVINPSSYDRGADYAGLSAGSAAYPAPEMTGNPTLLPADVVPAGVPIRLSIKNNGEKTVRPIAVVVMEVLK